MVVAVFLLIVSSPDTLCQSEEPTIMIGFRALGMGGASVTTANNEEMLLSNPAALSQVKDPVFSSFDLRVGSSYDSVPFLDRLIGYSRDTDLSDLTETQIDALNALDPLYKLNGPLNITYIRRYFGLGFFQTLDVAFDPIYHGSQTGGSKSSDLSSVQLNVQPTTFAMTAFAIDKGLPPWPSWVSIGGAIKYVVRAEVSHQDMTKIRDDGFNEAIGRALALDVGVLYRIRETYTFGLMVRDALGAKFTWNHQLVEGKIEKDKSPRTTSIKAHTSIGASFTPDWEAPRMLQDFVLALDVDKMQALELGAEVAVYRFLKLRAGISGNGIAFGFGFKVDIFAFDYAYVSRYKDEYVEGTDRPGHFLGFAMRL